MKQKNLLWLDSSLWDTYSLLVAVATLVRWSLKYHKSFPAGRTFLSCAQPTVPLLCCQKLSSGFSSILLKLRPVELSGLPWQLLMSWELVRAVAPHSSPRSTTFGPLHWSNSPKKALTQQSHQADRTYQESQQGLWKDWGTDPSKKRLRTQKADLIRKLEDFCLAVVPMKADRRDKMSCCNRVLMQGWRTPPHSRYCPPKPSSVKFAHHV